MARRPIINRSTVTAAAAGTVVLPDNPSRLYLRVTNTGAGAAQLRLQGPQNQTTRLYEVPVVDAITLQPNESWVMDAVVYTGPVYVGTAAGTFLAMEV